MRIFGSERAVSYPNDSWCRDVLRHQLRDFIAAFDGSAAIVGARRACRHLWRDRFLVPPNDAIAGAIFAWSGAQLRSHPHHGCKRCSNAGYEPVQTCCRASIDQGRHDPPSACFGPGQSSYSRGMRKVAAVVCTVTDILPRVVAEYIGFTGKT